MNEDLKEQVRQTILIKETQLKTVLQRKKDHEELIRAVSGEQLYDQKKFEISAYFMAKLINDLIKQGHYGSPEVEGGSLVAMVLSDFSGYCYYDAREKELKSSIEWCTNFLEQRK